MKTITIHIDDTVIRVLNADLNVKRLCLSYGSVTDQAINKIIKAIEKDQSELTLTFKEGAEY